MRIFYPFFDGGLEAVIASRMFSFLETRPSYRRERAIPSSVMRGVGFLLNNTKILYILLLFLI